MLRLTPLPEACRAKYARANRKHRVRQARLGCFLALLMMPAGLALDCFVYPQHLWPMLQARLGSEVLLLAVLWLLFQRSCLRLIPILGVLWLLVPAVAIAAMIALSQGAASPYYAGLNLVLIACLLMPFTWRDSTVVASLTLALFLIACLVHHHRHPQTTIPVASLVNNCFFIILTGVISVTASHFANLRRIEDFRLRYELAESYGALRRYEVQRSHFIANISHELRTPLTVILAPLEDLLADPSRLDPALTDILRTARSNGLRLLKLINDLLELVRLDAGTTLKLEPQDLSDLVKGVVASMRHLARIQHLELDCRCPQPGPVVTIDTSRMEKVLVNLLSNAIKFTPPHGRIEVTVEARPDQAVLSVRDTGQGIPAAELPHLFERFHQVDGSPTRRYYGAGIGLSLVKELVEDQQGRIRVDSTVGQGTVMVIELPRTTAAPVGLPEPGATDTLTAIHAAAERTGGTVGMMEVVDEGPHGQAHGAVVLVVDDEPDVRRYLVARLGERFRVHQCDRGSRAVTLARELRPDLILLDLMMPEIDGLDVCRILRSDQALTDTRIILLTAHSGEANKLEALNRGADDFLSKPFSALELVTRVSTQLRTLHLQRELRQRGDELESAYDKLKKTEALLVHGEKMKALGVLSAGILHEVNNPLNYVMSAVRLLRKRQLDQNAAELLTDAWDGVERIHRIVKDLGKFAHHDPNGGAMPTDLGEAIGLALRLCAKELQGITLEQQLPTAPVLVPGSSLQLSQVVVNLLLNAAHAVRDPRVQGRTPTIRLSLRPQTGKVSLAVWDNGTGIAPEHQPHLFEPFFTTRKVGEGQGLGLSICHTIIQAHRGTISVDSQPGAWTTFTIDLPTST